METNSVAIKVTVPRSVGDKLKEMAQREQRTLAGVVRRILLKSVRVDYQPPTSAK